MEKYNHQAGLKIVGEVMPSEHNRVTLAEEKDRFGLPIARVTFSYGDNDKRLIRHAMGSMRRCLDARRRARAVGRERRHLPTSTAPRAWATIRAHSVVNADCRSWDIPNLWICDGSVFPTVGGVNPSLTIQAIACRTADRIRALAARGEL